MSLDRFSWPRTEAYRLLRLAIGEDILDDDIKFSKKVLSESIFVPTHSLE